MTNNHIKARACFYLKIGLSTLLLSCFLNVNIHAQNKILNNSWPDNLEAIFKSAPDTIQTSIYWYWLSDNISKEGVVKDLEAMKKVGINRAFIGNIGLTDVPFGRVKIFTDEWWAILHTALKTATKLGIQIGLFNGPGWSQSGGPWVKPESSMRYLSSSEIVVNGPVLVHQKIAKPDLDFQDVKVIAYPVAKDYYSDIRNLKYTISANPNIDNINNCVDKHDKTSISLIAKSLVTIDIETDKPYTARSLVIYPGLTPALFKGEIQMKDDQGFHTIKSFTIDRSVKELWAGFKPTGAATISIPETTSKVYRIKLTSLNSTGEISEIKISSAPVVEDYIGKTLGKMVQNEKVQWSDYQWSAQPGLDNIDHVIDPDKVIDISKYMAADGTLNWNAPAGSWIIERTGMLPTKVLNAPTTPEGSGLESDKMDRGHIITHFQNFLGEVMRRIPAEDRRSLKVTVADSYEVGSQNWSNDMLHKFMNHYGYDATVYLPVMQGKVVGSIDQSNRFLWDMRRFIADQIAYEYVGGLREVSHQFGLTTWLENYGHGGFPAEFLQYGGQSDEVSGEFWIGQDLGKAESRAAASCAHIYGKNKVSAESFTGTFPPFVRYPALFKQKMDRFFAEGINNTLLHVYISQPADTPLPGVYAWFGSDFHRLNTWFYDMDIFLKYIKRCNLMLQQGKYVADVAYFIGEDAPKMTGIQDPQLPPGYSYDYINAEVILNRLSVKDGKLILPDGMKYNILVLPKLETIRPELLLKIKEFVSQGAIVLGPKPSKSPSLQNFPLADQIVQKTANELWGDIDSIHIKRHRYGKGIVMNGMTMEQALKSLNTIPDYKSSPSDSTLFIHRELDGASIYFVSNQKNENIRIKPEYRITGKIPELWDALTGNTSDILDFTQTTNNTAVGLELAPYGSAFIIFRKEKKQVPITNCNKPRKVLFTELEGEWLVKFDSKMRGPSKGIVFRQLEDWTKNSNDSIKYYSGTAHYYKTFESKKLIKGTTITLNLNRVSAIAKVKVNNIEMGGVWTEPYKLDITDAIKPGKNQLEIKVVNTWKNRLIGDGKLPETERKTQFNYRWFYKTPDLEPSGLIGPVKIETLEPVN